MQQGLRNLDACELRGSNFDRCPGMLMIILPSKHMWFIHQVSYSASVHHLPPHEDDPPFLGAAKKACTTPAASSIVDATGRLVRRSLFSLSSSAAQALQGFGGICYIWKFSPGFSQQGMVFFTGYGLIPYLKDFCYCIYCSLLEVFVIIHPSNVVRLWNKEIILMKLLLHEMLSKENRMLLKGAGECQKSLVVS